MNMKESIFMSVLYVGLMLMFIVFMHREANRNNLITDLTSIINVMAFKSPTSCEGIVVDGCAVFNYITISNVETGIKVYGDRASFHYVNINSTITGLSLIPPYYVNVAKMGADMQGKEDSTKAVNNSLDCANAVERADGTPYQLSVRFPKGDVLILDNLFIEGQGKDSSMLKEGKVE